MRNESGWRGATIQRPERPLPFDSVEKMQGLMVQKPEEAGIEPVAVVVPSKDWHRPVATFIQARSAENAPGSTPDFGVDYS